jgi:tRNA/rRNA methyltransferase
VSPPIAVDFVLVRPARAANVAAACRALKNMGQRRLWLVDAACDIASPSARALAHGAWDVLDGALAVATLAQALADVEYAVATSGRASGPTWSPRQLAQELAGGRRGRVALVFGPEASGLTLAEQRQCHALVRIPTAPEQPSLNLAQAVLVLAYEIFMADGSAQPSDPIEAAPVAEQEAALADLRAAWLSIGYLNPDSPDALLAEYRRLLARAAPTSRELLLLRGLARQTAWAGRVARDRTRGR